MRGAIGGVMAGLVAGAAGLAVVSALAPPPSQPPAPPPAPLSVADAPAPAPAPVAAPAAPPVAAAPGAPSALVAAAPGLTAPEPAPAATPAPDLPRGAAPVRGTEAPPSPPVAPVSPVAPPVVMPLAAAPDGPVGGAAPALPEPAGPELSPPPGNEPAGPSPAVMARAPEAGPPAIPSDDGTALAPDAPASRIDRPSDPQMLAGPPEPPGAAAALLPPPPLTIVAEAPVPVPPVEPVETEATPPAEQAPPIPTAQPAAPAGPSLVDPSRPPRADPAPAVAGAPAPPAGPAPQPGAVMSPPKPLIPAGSLLSRTAVRPVPGAGDLPDAAPTADADPRPLVRFARPFDNPQARPLLAIVLIDPGDPALDRTALAALPFAVTFALDPNDPGATLAATIYRAAGQEVVMQATGLPQGATAADVEVSLAANAAALPEAVAVIDLERNGFQENRLLAGMVVPVVAAQGRGVLSWDRGLNAASQVARREGVPQAVVLRMIDASPDPVMIRRHLDRAAFAAGREGKVIVAGTTAPETVATLLEWSVEGRAASLALALAPVSAVLAAP